LSLPKVLFSRIACPMPGQKIRKMVFLINRLLFLERV